jgi:hypothetical protein
MLRLVSTWRDGSDGPQLRGTVPICLDFEGGPEAPRLGGRLWSMSSSEFLDD